jgi:predicted metal-dependent hydrolase
MLRRAIRLADGDLVEVGGARVRLKVSGRARGVSLRLDRLRGEMLAVAPSIARLPDAVAFARERGAWVAQRLAERRPKQSFEPGMELRVFGEPCRLVLAPARASLEGPGWERGVRVTLGSEQALFGRAALLLLKGHAKTWFAPRLVAHCGALPALTPRFAITNPRARWGSCTPADRRRPASIRLSWRLALAPPEVADYVAAHECAHLLEPNHSPRFWAHVERLVGDPRPHRAWLRANGAALHAYEP